MSGPTVLVRTSAGWERRKVQVRQANGTWLWSTDTVPGAPTSLTLSTSASSASAPGVPTGLTVTTGATVPAAPTLTVSEN